MAAAFSQDGFSTPGDRCGTSLLELSDCCDPLEDESRRAAVAGAVAAASLDPVALLTVDPGTAAGLDFGRFQCEAVGTAAWGMAVAFLL